MMQMLSSVSPGLELRRPLATLLRSIFSDSQESDAESGFLHRMQNMTGATTDGQGHARLSGLLLGQCWGVWGCMRIEQLRAW